MQNRIYVIVFFLILLIGVYLRFSYLDWGKPFFFHPDENNITTAIVGLSIQQWNPHFFAYGSLPIYITYFLSFLLSLGKPSFATITYTLRALSATFSFLIIPSLFYIGKRLYSKQVGFTAAILASVGTGLIQYAHFGTFEMWLAFFSLWFFYSCNLLWKHTSKKHLLLVGLFGGILIGIKISSLVLIPIPLFILALRYQKIKMAFFIFSALYFLLIFFLYAITNPYIILDTNTVLTSLHYESSVALGAVQVFYTQSFLHTIPFIFQLQYVFPFLVNPFAYIIFLYGFLFLFIEIIKKSKTQEILLVLFFLIIFLSQAFFFVKWNRYMVSSIPFLYLTIAIAFSALKKKFFYIATLLLFCISLLYAFIFFFTVYPNDSRISASAFAKKHIALQSATIEPYDLGVLPFFNIFSHQTTVNLYDIDDNQSDAFLKQSIKNTTIFLSPSQRLSRTRLKYPNDFPLGNNFYKKILGNEFRIIYQTPCNAFCKILYNGDQINNVEETASVFDHPFVTIFEKL